MRSETAVRSLIVSGLLVAVVAIAAAVVLAAQQYSLAELPFQLRNKDFANYWIAARLAVEGRAMQLFGPPAAYFEEMKALFGADYPWHNWSYPPHAALLLMPLGLIDYLPGMALFLGVTLALYLIALATLEARWSPMAVILILPFITANLASTQNGFLTTGLLVAGLALRARNPVLAGMLFGVLTFKPQLGFLLPILLIAEWRWRVIVSATVTAAALVLMSVLAFGFESWTGYFRFVTPYQTEIMNTFGGDFPFMMGSAFGSARSYGLPWNTALLVHLPFAAAGLALFGWSLWAIRDLQARAFSLLLATLIVTPYSVAYDFGAVATFAALWPIAARMDLPQLPLRLSLVAVTILPVVVLPLGKAGLPLTPVVLLVSLVALLASEGAFRQPFQPSPPKP